MAKWRRPEGRGFLDTVMRMLQRGMTGAKNPGLPAGWQAEAYPTGFSWDFAGRRPWATDHEAMVCPTFSPTKRTGQEACPTQSTMSVRCREGPVNWWKRY